MLQKPLPYSLKQIAQFCQRWKIVEFALFGSVLRADFQDDSDVDVLVSFHENASWSLFDLIHMEDELVDLFGRPVDLIEKEGLRNPYRRKHILKSREVLYAPR